MSFFLGVKNAVVVSALIWALLFMIAWKLVTPTVASLAPPLIFTSDLR